MRVYLNEVSTNSLTRYIYQYKDYFRNLYSDTGIFSESEILHYYETEAEKRKIEILEIIQTRLSPELVLGRSLEQTIGILWRSKIFSIAWEDVDENSRVVTYLQILNT